MNAQLNQFCQNWLAKADAYNSGSLADHFDKFMSLYVSFNALYMDVMTELVLSGKELPKDFRDKKAATDYVIQYLKSSYLIDNLLNDEQSTTDLDGICTIIEQERFHIIIDWGIPQRQADLQLLDNLRANSRQKKGTAILSLFYHIRCNMFHGHKNFENRQRSLLAPTNRLLRKTVTLTMQKLNA